MIAIPGTWESSVPHDPLNPGQFPIALLLSVTVRSSSSSVRTASQVYTVPYTAQFHNPLSADKQMSYNDSRGRRARAAAVRAMTDMNNRCPLTSYVLVGFSQGAVIAGDWPATSATAAVQSMRISCSASTLIADGRRQPGVGQDIGPAAPGEGAEITLKEVPTLSALGLTM